MKTDLNTLLTTLYVHLDDRILPALGFSRDHHPGRKPVLSDVELLCLIVAQHLLGIASEPKWIRYAHTHLLGMFPSLPQQSGWSKRVRQTTGLLSAVITELAHDTPSWGERARLIDSTPVPCGKSRETVLRHDKHLIRPGQIIIGDKGFAGKDFETFITRELEAELIRPDRKDEKPRFGKLGGIRQWVQSVFDTMKRQLTLEDHGGRSIPGVYSRVAGRLLALATGIWHNWLIGEPNKRSLIAYDH